MLECINIRLPGSSLCLSVYIVLSGLDCRSMSHTAGLSLRVEQRAVTKASTVRDTRMNTWYNLSGCLALRRDD